jgi:large subunit ribosomal protein L22
MHMLKYSLNPNPKKSAKAYGRSLNISQKNAINVCRAISGTHIAKGKRLLEDMIDGKRSLKGKYYTSTAGRILDVVKAAEANAEFKGLDTSRLVIFASAHKGFTFIRPRRTKLKRTQRKIANIQVVLLQK